MIRTETLNITFAATYSPEYDCRDWDSFTMYAPGAGGASYRVLIQLAGKDSPASGDWVDLNTTADKVITVFAPGRKMRLRVVDIISDTSATDGVHIVARLE